MKKFSSFILSIVVIVGVLTIGATTASAATEYTSGYYTYTVSNRETAITDCNTSISGDVTIPSTLGGYPVTSIGDRAFYWCDDLTSITIPDSVTSIGEYAFYECESLTSVYYRGSEEGRSKISIDGGNSYLTSATWYYNSCIGSSVHTYDNACDAECNVCKATRTITHTYSNNCDKSCNVCGKTRTVGAHKYDKGKENFSLPC